MHGVDLISILWVCKEGKSSELTSIVLLAVRAEKQNSRTCALKSFEAMIEVTFAALCGVCRNVNFRKRSRFAASRKRGDTRRARARSSAEQ